MLACKSLSRARREHPEQVVGTWGSAEEQEKPCGLQVPNSRQAGEQLVLGLAFAVQPAPVARRLRSRAKRPAPVVPAGPLARTRRPSRLVLHRLVGDRQGRQVLCLQRSIREFCLGSSVCAHGATARPPGRRAAQPCALVLTRHTCRPRARRWPHPPVVQPLPRLKRRAALGRRVPALTGPLARLRRLATRHVRCPSRRAKCRRWHCRRTDAQRAGAGRGPGGTGDLPAWLGATRGHMRRLHQRIAP